MKDDVVEKERGGECRRREKRVLRRIRMEGHNREKYYMR